jgi:hypothetical protein
MTLFAKKSEAEKTQITKDKIKRIEKAIVDYVDSEGYIPCPAKGNSLEADALFGDSIASANYNTTNHVCSNNTTNNVGMIPVRTLGLDDSYAYDGWDRKFSYHIAKGMGNAYDFSDPNYRGDISIVDYYGIERTNTKFLPPKNYGAAFVIISFGGDGIGAWGKNSSSNNTVQNTNSIEYQNHKYLFNSNNIYVQDGTYSNFDDIVSFKTKLFLTSGRLSVSPIKVPDNLCNDANAIVAEGFPNGGTTSTSITGTVPTASASTSLATQIYLSSVKLQKLCNSPPLTASTTTSAVPSCYFNPRAINNLKLWLDANDTTAGGGTQPPGAVNIWYDKSGNSNNATSTSGASVSTASVFPLNSLLFNGTNDYNISLSSLDGQDKYTIFIVEASRITNTNSNVLLSTSNNCPLLQYSYNATSYNNQNNPSGYNNFNYHFNNNNNVIEISAADLVPIMPNLWVAKFNNTAATQILNVYSANGVLASTTQTSSICSSSIAGGVIGRSSSATNGYNGYIAEILIYNQEITPSNMNAIQSYLISKWFTGECI